jgi:hypothetical protein
MNLIDKEDCLLLVQSAAFSGLLDYAAQVGHTGADGAYRAKVRIGAIGDNTGQSGLAAARRPPEYNGR